MKSEVPAVPLISVIVPHYNDLAALDLCLQSLSNQSVGADRLEIVVCDNNSPLDQSAIAAAIGGRARLVVEREKGAGPARNRAVSASEGEVLAFIDCDCIAEPDWLANGLAALDGGDAVGGRVVVFSTAERPSGADLFEQIFAFDQQSYVERKGFSVTANLFCSRTVFDAVGGFANGVSEDVDWCHRARNKGFSLTYADNAVVRHPSRPDWPALRQKWRRMTSEAFRLDASRGGGRFGWAARQVAVAASAAPHSLRVFATDLPLESKLRAIGVLWRIRAWRAAEGIRLALSGRT